MHLIHIKNIPFPDSITLENKYELDNFFNNLFLENPYDEFKMTIFYAKYKLVLDLTKINLDSLNERSLQRVNEGLMLAVHLKKHLPKLIEDFQNTPWFYDDIELEFYLEDLQELYQLTLEVYPEIKH